MQNISNYDFKGKRALIRVDFNVPLNKETLEVTDKTRISAVIPTIKKILAGGGSVVLMSHLGRPKEGFDEKLSLKNIAGAICEELGLPVIFAGDCISDEAFNKSSSLNPGEVLLLDNLRFHKEEESGDSNFAKLLAKHGDVYVNDAFGTAHRAHASTAIIADYFPNDKMFGYLIEKEIESVDEVLNSGKKPLTAIVGGAKVSSKITIIEQMLAKVDHLIIGGGMAYTFVKAQGGKVGSSLVEDDYLDMARKIMSMANEKGVKIHIPSDTVIADSFSNDANRKTCAIDQIPDGWMGLDIATESEKTFSEVIMNSKLILWNGPMGVFEMSNFQHGTATIAKAVANATSKGAFSLVGGGDSVAAVNQFDLADQVSHVSTGGGAMLEYLEGIDLPGIAAIRK
ncbi:MAG: phosphoglycerate kinase [Flavobacteriales bacterium]|nr:phosphoglycerate kinase [Flavobacteriales bacterium]MCB9197380.1 phosphoglycerate kinase [Flavobacteriales bacterium]